MNKLQLNKSDYYSKLQLNDEQKQTELIDLIDEETRDYKDALQFMGLEEVDGEVRIKK